MSVLELERVTKRNGRGLDQRVILREVSLQIDLGELVAVWGARRSGRSTLLRIAAGIAQPDEGVVRFQGQDLAGRGDHHRAELAYCLSRHAPRDSEVVLDQIIADQILGGLGTGAAEAQARRVLTRAGVEHCAGARFNGLDPAEAVRVAVARGLARQPKLLVIDEPTLGVDLLLRDEILMLLRSIADEGVAVLMTTGDTPCLSVADRRLSLDGGELHGNISPRVASVLPLRRSA
jgi:ABC-type multidrug transport system ATPase subunit